MNKKNKNVGTAISPTRAENFPEWYQTVVKEADMAEMITVRFRTEDPQEKKVIPIKQFIQTVGKMLDDIQKKYFEEAKARLESRIYDFTGFSELEEHLTFRDSRPGFVRAPWFLSEEEDERLKSLGITLRCIPFVQRGIKGKCILTGKTTSIEAIFAKAY